MDYTFKPPAGLPHMPTKIPRATRGTDPNVSRMISSEPAKVHRAPPNQAEPGAQSTMTRRTSSQFPPHIMIYPWDGSSWSRQEFTNHLLARSYFHPDETRNDREKMIWAISHFRGHAANIAGDFLGRLTGENGSLVGASVDDSGAKAHGNRAVWTPDTWEKFLDLYLEHIEEKVARRGEWVISKVSRGIWTLVYMIMRLLMWCAVVVLGAGLLVQLSGVAAENSDVFWTWTRGRIVPTV